MMKKATKFRMADHDAIALDISLRTTLRRWKQERRMQDFHALERMLEPLIMSLPDFDGQGTFSEALTFDEYERQLENHALWFAMVAHLQKCGEDCECRGIQQDFENDINNEKG
jgi:hypothetical protein